MPNKFPKTISNKSLLFAGILLFLAMLIGIFPSIVHLNHDDNVDISGLTRHLPIVTTKGDLNHLTQPGQGLVKLAILDTGIDADHPHLKIAGGANFVSDAENWDDDNGHGTHVAGIVTDTLENLGVLSEIDIYAVKVISHSGKGYISDVVKGLDWAVANQMDIVVMTFTTGKNSGHLRRAIDNAYAQGIVMAAAAGNAGYIEGKDTIMYPALYSPVISVGSVDAVEERMPNSSSGIELDLVAPGANIFSTVPGGYSCMSGTSMAAAYVGGVAAYLKASGIAPNDIECRLANSAKDLGDAGHDIFYGWGLVDAEAAVAR